MTSLWCTVLLAVATTYGIARSEPLRERRLPQPTERGGSALWSVLTSRHSQRAFGDRELTPAELGQLLWAAQGQLGAHRTAPSAGALYPLTVRVVDARGIWRYVPADHALVLEASGDRRAALAAAAYGQASLRSAPVTLLITGDLSITAAKYGTRAERFVTLEAGHVAQNVLLAATALGLAAVPIGAFDDAALRALLPRSATPLYLIPIGSPP